MAFRVAGYVKLAKLWEKNRDNAIMLHNQYFTERFQNEANYRFARAYIDITGNKNIRQRPAQIPAHVDHGAHVSVGNGVNVAAVAAQGGRAQGNFLHDARLPGDGHDVAHIEPALAPQEHAGDEILDQRLAAEADGHAADPRDRQQGGDVHAQRAEGDQGDGKVQYVIEYAGGQALNGFRLRRGARFFPIRGA